MTSEFSHTPVLLAETIAALQPRAGGRYIDATVGAGGHAEKVLELSSPDGALLALDADPAALAAAGQRLQRFGSRVVFAHTYFDSLGDVAYRFGFDGVDGILFDLGVSSPQIDQAARGFSFRQDARLDMRFDPEAETTAADLVNTLSSAELQQLFSRFGEERFAGRIARRVVEARRLAPIRTTEQLASLVVDSTPPSREAIHPATRVFQALRIAVNDELGRLGRTLPQAVTMLNAGGRLAAISFHSLEDRIVKQFMRTEARGCVCPPQVPVCVCDHQATLKILSPRPITSGVEELSCNPRARSAKLRVAERLGMPRPSPRR